MGGWGVGGTPTPRCPGAVPKGPLYTSLLFGTPWGMHFLGHARPLASPGTPGGHKVRACRELAA